jgi:hypothetical protein
MPRYVVLEHDHPVLHWDLMLEEGAVLRSWRLESAPSSETMIRCEAIPPHRLAYLEYEGPVSGGRGTVVRTAKGDFTLLSEAESGLELHFDTGDLAGLTATIAQVESGLCIRLSRRST